MKHLEGQDMFYFNLAFALQFVFSSPFAVKSVILICYSWCLFVCPVTWRKPV